VKHTEINFMFGLLNGSVKYWNKEGVLAVDGQFCSGLTNLDTKIAL